ncbi:DUF4336 domain-containing protein [Novosphingobium sp. M1R2S20]|uniref:DUF4336 domain-containing protein n=1 Tax=Novosphingobium rhizovicinum TaxID=3228928 RepID=A0ABV3RHK3_9SPHN
MALGRHTTIALGSALATAGTLVLYRQASKSQSEWDETRVGYLPLDKLKQLGDDLWIVDTTITASGLCLPVRMTIIRLPNGDLMLHSPTRCTAELTASISALGRIAHLIAPTFAHWLYLRDWQAAFPEATSWAVPGLRDRAQVQTSGTRIDRDLGEDAPSQWRDVIEQGLVAGGGGFEECFFFHRPSATLLLCDLIQNLEASKLAPLARMVARAAAGTRGTTALHVRTALRLGGSEAKAQVQKIVRLQPRRVIFAHGAPFEKDAAARLRCAFAWLVRE